MRLLIAIALLSAAAIAYEILLMRLFSIVQWHHFAYMIISLALLGYGASGTFIALARGWLLDRFDAVFAVFAALFGVLAVAAFALAQRLPFNPLEIVWDTRQQLYLLALYLVLAVPFFCAASCIGLALARYGAGIERIYRADLMGAGAGALAIVAVLFALPPGDCLALIGGAGLVAAGLGCAGRRAVAAALIAVGVVAPLLVPEGLVEPRLSPYKGLSQALRIPGARVIETRSSPLGVLSVVESPETPLRHAPGLSLMSRADIPAQLGVFTDGGAMTPILRGDGPENAAYLDDTSAALPYHLLDRPRVLVLGAGGGADVRLALFHGARRIDAVEVNPQMAALVAETHAEFAGNLYARPGVVLHIAEARGFAARSTARYELVHLALFDAFTASAAGLHALNESTLYTVEALETLLDRLDSGGFLAITRWLRLPPRDSVKLLATAIAALERRGVAEPRARLAVIRSWDTATLLVKNGALTADDETAVRRFAEARAFDIAYLPGMRADEANRRNILPRPYLHEAAVALLGPRRDAFLAGYKFDVAPATDDRPYFFHFMKWRVLPELLRLRLGGGVPLIEWGTIILAATLVQAALASLVLVLAPLGVLKRAAGGPSLARVAVYFLALGLAFLFVEIAFMQRFALFLSHPLYAIAVVLSAFLVFAGLGSGAAKRFGERWRLPPIALAVGCIVVIAAVYLALLPVLFDWLRPLPEAARVAVSVGLIAPLAFFMGMPFPLGLARVAEAAPALVPWAWAINGCASVIAAVLATLLAVHWGFTVVVALALAFYVVAAAFAPKASSNRSESVG